MDKSSRSLKGKSGKKKTEMVSFKTQHDSLIGSTKRAISTPHYGSKLLIVGEEVLNLWHGRSVPTSHRFLFLVWGVFSCGSCIWIDDTRLVFQPPTTTQVTNNVVVKQPLLLTILQPILRTQDEWNSYYHALRSGLPNVP